MLEVTNLRKVYPTGDEALTGVSTTIEGNEIVAMIGPSGAGKSTFIRCINRLTDPTEGEVTLDGTELTALDSGEMKTARRNVGMVFQEYNLVERLTVMENVLSGRLGYVSNWAALRRNFPQEDVEMAYDILETVGLGGMENKRADELSGGQRQRVGIARAVVQEPKILLADEPTSSLDPDTSHAVMELLTEIAAERNIPVLINIHEVHLAVEYADRILGLHEGELVFDGPTADLDENAKDVIYRGKALAGESSSNYVEGSDTVTGETEPTDKSTITGD
ncbi:phosphonate ABC transporter ATP-binding protein [Natronobacterium gregoryi]|uniref:Phosphonate ABC transporter ATP-binding protein n=2 Tax=Natronobacterium gregoryi TaxID=44930 RepID=L0ALK3_NATGS|nr:phosphonate ABC transporter ATP-binding protein [Natronobacterium gregoryi]AFZ73935.1 phosphonate ABC transporter, ATP-binding protein [Natronobacterium gregoryi SP2]ELY71729.1 phosphonate ABC transporter ATPase [Natronobacterium gregoryi SP2]PLK19515.1 phosphonate ABC transporter ATP-binding protein [Natronobacterium gregoryi SP2]SFJ46909.1 phosphonate transport system ATP-binding protein [Natronobacterium gregoryi]